MNIVIGSDHAGLNYKNILAESLKSAGYEVIDVGSFGSTPADDYPDRAAAVAKALLNKQGERGILICGSAVGVSIAANKFKGIRAGVCHDTYSGHQAVEHDDVNVLCMGERVIGIALAEDIMYAFLNARFSGAARHLRRLKKIAAIEDKNMKGEVYE